MALSFDLTEDEQSALETRAQAHGISTHEAAHHMVREFVSAGKHRDGVRFAAHLIIDSHGDALDRLGR